VFLTKISYALITSSLLYVLTLYTAWYNEGWQYQVALGYYLNNVFRHISSLLKPGFYYLLFLFIYLLMYLVL
jgi:hypothetical protein